MCKSLTPYMLVFGPIVMMAGFIMSPELEDLLGQAYLSKVKSLDMNMTLLTTFTSAFGILMLFGGLFLLSQDLMANSGKMQQDMLMMSRLGFMFAFTVFYLFFGMQLESISIAQGGNDIYADDSALSDETALDLHYMAENIWSSLPIALCFALILFGSAAVTGNNSPKEPIEWVYGLPILGGLGMMAIFWVEEGFGLFLFAMFSSVPTGILMLTGHLNDTAAEPENSEEE